MNQFKERFIEVDRQIVGLYRGWEELDPGLVIDTDVSDPSIEPTKFESRDEIREASSKLRQGLPAFYPFNVVAARLRAAEAYLDILDGKNMPFAGQINSTLGVPGKPSSSEEVAVAYRDVQTLMEMRGLTYSPEGRKEYIERFGIDSDEEIREAYSELHQWIGKVLSPPRLTSLPDQTEPVIVKDDEPYQAYAGKAHGSDRLIALYNIHPRFLQTHGFIALRALHEYAGHVNHYGLWQQTIEKQNRGRTFLASNGIFTTHGPDVVQAEAVAHFATHAYSNRLPANFQHNLEVDSALDFLTSIVKNNMHFIVNVTKDPEQAAEYAGKYLHFEQKADLFDSASKRLHNPVLRMYFGAEMPALHAAVESGVAIMDTSYRTDWLHYLLSGPRSYDKIMQRVSSAGLNNLLK